MKKALKRTMIGLMAMLALTTMMGISAMAGGVNTGLRYLAGSYAMAICKPNEPLSILVGYDGTLSVTSSKKRVASVTPYKQTINGHTVHGFKLKALRPGTTTIKIRYKYDNQTYTKSIKIKTYKWKNPFSILKVGKKGFKNAFKNTDQKKIAAVNGKLKIKMRSGYKLKEVRILKSGTENWKKISKTANVTLAKGDQLEIIFRDNVARVKNSSAIFTVK